MNFRALTLLAVLVFTSFFRTASSTGRYTSKVISEVVAIGIHIRSNEWMGGLSGSASGETIRMSFDEMTPFTVTAGDDAYGSWYQILGSTDTPIEGGMTHFDLQEIIVTDVSVAADLKIHRIQIGYGTSGSSAVSNGDVTHELFIPERGSAVTVLDFHSKGYPATTKVWISLWVDGVTTPTMDCFFSIHELNE